jgi:hypothetical protein
MRTGHSTAIGRILGAAALCAVVAGGPTSRADDAAQPPTVERIELDEKSGRVAEALDGWATRYLGVSAPAERAVASKRYVELAARRPVDADPWLVSAVANSGAGFSIVAGRRVVLVTTTEALGGADVGRVAAVLDAVALAVERIVGARPPVGKPGDGDKRPRDSAGRFLVGTSGLPKPASEQAFETSIGPPDAKNRGVALSNSFADACARAAIAAAPNRRARLLEPAVSLVVADLVAREIGEPSVIPLVDQFRARVKERYELDWAPGCLPGESIAADDSLTELFFRGLEAERAAKREPADAMHAFFATARPDSWSNGRVGSPRDLGLESVAASFSPAFVDVFRRAGVMPVGRAFDEMKARAEAEQQCREAEGLRFEDGSRAAAARMFRAAADQLAGGIAADELTVEALELEEKDDAKRTRAAAKKLGLIEGFEFLGPLPGSRPNNDVPVASRLMPFAVSTAEGRRPLKMKEPVDISLKWADVKDPFDHLVERTPWGDKRGINSGGATVAALKWTKDLGRVIRLRPCRSEWADVSVLCDGRVAERWPDGSVLVSGGKGAEIVLTSAARITCSVPWRDAKSVDADLAANAAEPDAVLALRPWAARRVAAALPVVVDALAKLADAEFVRDVVLLAPYRGGDAAACEAMLAHARGRPAALAAYLDVCRGARDVAVLDKIVALGTSADAAPEIVAKTQAVVEGALFRRTTEKGAELAAVWERGKKWLAGVAVAEAEDVRDLHDANSSFRVAVDAAAWGRACIAPNGWGGRRGEGYLPLDVPAGGGAAFLAVRWQPSGGARLTLKGYFADGRKQTPFSIDVPAVGASDKPQWSVDVFELGPIPHGKIVLAIDDPCAAGYKLDALAVGAKPIE